ncbi:Xaa-Pro dipeptidyl-peptidase [Undibacterium cyanobacteriorum]|uniref:Xaa-Pro dipeptidyl-peptidase n=1 Tax=Undibacterium cyanobacteriorum TaxID=3073561 RepID=A0ABY9RJQ5_9BURK|nr:Xaa-Pro dipeptidyl-peptidase [Undibacterium sp. 20NA77.5]WMW80880.1 Xaa-Pro dipeptidyl-peptidase [Undibacterium sp. 20NA77.5]
MNRSSRNIPARLLPLKPLALALSLLAAAPLIAQESQPSAETQKNASTKAVPTFYNGQAQVVPGFQDKSKWIKQELWVETEFDSDGDGKRDRMHVDVTRPQQTATEGLKVAVVYASSPYYAGTMKNQKMWDVQHELGSPPPPRPVNQQATFVPVRPEISRDEIDTWVPRGFAVVHSEAPGTGLSEGCPTVGGAPEELAPKAVIDWLNGRAKGYTSRDGNEEVKADWSTGKVGMTGTSYNGTIPLAAATTGVAGLEAIIPIAPNTSYYHYYRSNGLIRHPGGYLGEDVDQLYDFVYSGAPEKRDYCNKTIRDGKFMAGFDRLQGDYNDFWAERDLLTKIKAVKAATLLAHGQHDWNVMPEHSIRIYEALKKQGTPTQLFLHHGGHGGPPPMEMRNRWFSHYLYGIDNGVEKDARAMIMREGVERGSAPTPYLDFPNPEASMVSLNLGAGGNSIGALGTKLPANKTKAIEKLIDDVQFSGGSLASSEQSTNRLLYATPELKEALHMSGTPVIKLRVAANKAAANLSVWLVTLPFDPKNVGSAGQMGVVSRAWADPQNAESLTRGGNYDSKKPGRPLKSGQFVDLRFDLQPGDRIIPAGKRLALMVFSSDRDFTLWPKAGTELQLDLSQSQLQFPVVGGAEAWKSALE